MGVYINYSLKAEGSDADVLATFQRIRKRLLKMPLRAVGRIKRLEPVYNRLYLFQLLKTGYKLPKAIRDRLKGKQSTPYAMNCQLVGNPEWMTAPKELMKRFYKPVEDFIKTTDLWNEDDLPKEVDWGSLTIMRKGFSFELASIMLRRGYLMLVNVDEGCDTVPIGISTMGGAGVPLWLGQSGVKTQYATHFIDAHENVCRIVDCMKEEGLVREASDDCGFYEHRDWKKAAPIVNLETTFAQIVKGAITEVLAEVNKDGVVIEDKSDPATRNHNLVNVTDDEPDEPKLKAEKKGNAKKK